jgi:hypothetical protein
MLMNDVFGNYVIQKFLELQVDGPRAELAQQMRGQVRGLFKCRSAVSRGGGGGGGPQAA